MSVHINGTTEISEYDDVISSTDVIGRITWLTEELEDDENNDAFQLEEYQEELTSLKNLASQCEDWAADWIYGETLIRDSYFEDYAHELAESCYDMKGLGAFANYVDWEAWANDVQTDYTAVTFNTTTYYIR